MLLLEPRSGSLTTGVWLLEMLRISTMACILVSIYIPYCHPWSCLSEMSHFLQNSWVAAFCNTLSYNTPEPLLWQPSWALLCLPFMHIFCPSVSQLKTHVSCLGCRRIFNYLFFSFAYYSICLSVGKGGSSCRMGAEVSQSTTRVACAWRWFKFESSGRYPISMPRSKPPYRTMKLLLAAALNHSCMLTSLTYPNHQFIP